MTFAFCNTQGNIPNPVTEYVAFPYHDYPATSEVKSSGQCWFHPVTGVANDEAVGYRQVNGQWLAVATNYFSDTDNTWTEFDF
ncbi:hypothetical protein [Actinoallomurus rhizosphaericola]|uniref:hypothetical protein n=1 Tax=Actinoallomurus rhizosphaericola TaxID=2952536 RepID=UPI002092D137|nr:hypothetical protein [Actinoallomurus rhizosphaericola]MCO5995956.1 hypothetical protein [Actinoallomurus rhizosphaericola]